MKNQNEIENMEDANILIDGIDYNDTSIDTINESSVTYPGNEFTTSKLQNCKVYIHTAEGPIPHFHIRSLHTNQEEICIELKEPKYFVHGAKFENNSQCKDLYDWCTRKPSKYKGLTNWERLCYEWNRSVPNGQKINFEYEKQPDYVTQPNYLLLR